MDRAVDLATLEAVREPWYPVAAAPL